jgi:hypothetical protein
MKTYKLLNPKEKSQLLRFPVLVSLLAANSNQGLDNAEKMEAQHFTHIKTFSCDPLLTDFYLDAEKAFSSNQKEIESHLPKDSKERKEAITLELAKLEPLLNKLGSNYAMVLHKSMQDYVKHVSKAHNNVLESFFIPFPIKGLTD